MIKIIYSFSIVLLTSSYLVHFASASPSVTAKENLAQLVATRSCPNCDLTGLNFNRMDLSKTNLEGADLSMSSFLLTNLSYANMKNTILNGASFGGADLGDADLTGADLRGVSLDSAYLGGTKMTGEIITTKPFEDIGLGEVEKDVYVENQAIPKKPVQQKEVKVSERRDFGETPPVIVAPEKEIPVASKVVVVPVEESAPAENVVPEAPSVKKSMKVQQVKMPVVEKTQENEEKQAKNLAPQVEHKDDSQNKETVVDESKVVPKFNAPVIVESKEVLVDETKSLNVKLLFDTKSCYGCDLSGVNLSRKNLKGADLEKANLTGCDLEKANLKGANLKGALLAGANLKNANLKGADLYKADLSGADLTGAIQKNASFDGAILDNVVGLEKSFMLQNE